MILSNMYQVRHKMKITTKATWLGTEYGCRIFRDGELILEGRTPNRMEVGAVFRDLLRTLDTLGGNAFTAAARHRKFAEQGPIVNVKHIWHPARNC